MIMVEWSIVVSLIVTGLILVVIEIFFVPEHPPSWGYSVAVSGDRGGPEFQVFWRTDWLVGGCGVNGDHRICVVPVISH